MTADWFTEAREVLRAHGVGAFSGADTACRCDRRWRRNVEHEDHVADAVLAALAPHVQPRTDDWEYAWRSGSDWTDVVEMGAGDDARLEAEADTELNGGEVIRRRPAGEWEVAP